MISILKDYDNYDNNLYAPALDCGIIIGAISYGLTNNITYIPFFIKNVYILNKKSKIKYVYSVFLKQNIEEIILNSYFYDSEYNLVAIFNNLIMKCISNMNTNIYEICDNDIKITNKDINENYIFVKIEENNLLKLRDALLLNKKNIYLIDISENYEIVGFIRTIFNELDNVNFKICYYKKYDENIKKLMLKCYDLESFYIHEDNKLVNYKLKDYKI